MKIERMSCTIAKSSLREVQIHCKMIHLQPVMKCGNFTWVDLSLHNYALTFQTRLAAIKNEELPVPDQRDTFEIE
jgi:hypothetical protein